jgi:hypothetical protein
LCISSTFLKFKNKDYLLCRIVCGKNSPSHSRRKNKVSCDVTVRICKVSITGGQKINDLIFDVDGKRKNSPYIKNIRIK